MLTYWHDGMFDVDKFQHKSRLNAVIVVDDVPTQ